MEEWVSFSSIPLVLSRPASGGTLGQNAECGEAVASPHQNNRVANRSGYAFFGTTKPSRYSRVRRRSASLDFTNFSFLVSICSFWPRV